MVASQRTLKHRIVLLAIVAAILNLPGVARRRATVRARGRQRLVAWLAVHGSRSPPHFQLLARRSGAAVAHRRGEPHHVRHGRQRGAAPLACRRPPHPSRPASRRGRRRGAGRRRRPRRQRAPRHRLQLVRRAGLLRHRQRRGVDAARSAAQRSAARSLAGLGVAGCVLLAVTLPLASVVTGAAVLAVGAATWVVRRATSSRSPG